MIADNKDYCHIRQNVIWMGNEVVLALAVLVLGFLALAAVIRNNREATRILALLTVVVATLLIISGSAR